LLHSRAHIRLVVGNALTTGSQKPQAQGQHPEPNRQFTHMPTHEVLLLGVLGNRFPPAFTIFKDLTAPSEIFTAQSLQSMPHASFLHARKARPMLGRISAMSAGWPSLGMAESPSGPGGLQTTTLWAHQNDRASPNQEPREDACLAIRPHEDRSLESRAPDPRQWSHGQHPRRATRH